ncbi:3-keto-5-aminohexanoate cleavage protein [Feifania hominis]|uniref:3-keto-5-aminohexanoate cleavage protein n=1 Tax=Feifania hominis TaxID=2763660 RepID=A0A926DC53_9FIRM|nr:3-keto-5-aminohexanoate cleavage protein [Feifania hominis]
MAKQQRKVIVTAAVTGGIHTPTMTPYLPKGPDEVMQNALDAAAAGASIVHIHARLDNGQPTADFDTFEKILSGVKKKSDVVIGITTGGAQGMTTQERFAVIERFKPEMASANGGSINFCLSRLADGPGMDAPLHDWEVPFLKRTYDNVFKNTFADMEYCIRTMNACGTFPEFEVFDYGQLANLQYFKKMGILPKQIYLQFITGVMGGMPMSLECLLFVIDQAKKLLGEDVMYSMVAGGRRMFRFETVCAVTGGNVRVGLEDGIYIKPNGELAVNNAAQVEKIIKILHDLDFEIATPDEVRETFSLKGADKVEF